MNPPATVSLNRSGSLARLQSLRRGLFPVFSVDLLAGQFSHVIASGKACTEARQAAGIALREQALVFAERPEKRPPPDFYWPRVLTAGEHEALERQKMTEAAENGPMIFLICMV